MRPPSSICRPSPLLLLLATLAAATGGRAEEGVPSALDEQGALRLRYGAVYRVGSQEDAGPGLIYKGFTPNDFGLQASWFGGGWLGLAVSGEREGFSLFGGGTRITGGGLVRASAAAAGRWALGPLRLELGAGYGFSQLAFFGSSAAPTFLPGQRHALDLAGRLRLELPLGLRLEARGELPVSLAARDGDGHAGTASGYAVGAALAIPLGGSDTFGASLLADFQLTADRLVSNGGQVTSAQRMVRGGLALEFAWLRPEAHRPPPPPVETPVETSPPPPPPPRVGSVAVSVLDKQTGQPVPGARVKVQDRELPAGPDGQVKVNDVPPGPVPISASAEGYDPAQEVASVVAGRESPVTLQMVKAAERLPATLTGLVRSTRGGRPVPALLEIPEAKVRTRASPAGAFTIRLPGGTYSVIISAPGYLTQTKSVTVKDGEEAIFNVDLHPERHR